MEKKTYYRILGVSRTESASGIRAAYRDLAKRFHPDVAGEHATQSFREINEAYQVLSDAQRRREYNDTLSHAGGDRRASVGMRGSGAARPPVPIVAEPDGIRPSFDALYERWLRNFTGLRVPKSERLEALDFEVILTPSEAAHGCILPIAVPVFRPCAQCRGFGYDAGFPCGACDRRGFVEAESIVQMRIPPRIGSGGIYEIPLRRLGIHNLYLRVHIFVE